MQKEEIKNIPGMEDNKSVVIWKMNYGFQSDLQGEVNDISIHEVDNKSEGSATVDLQKTKLYNLIYGIFESVDLGIPAPSDLGMGLTQEEKLHRMRTIRNMEREVGDFIFEKIGKLNKKVDEKLKKNLISSSTEKKLEIKE